MPHLVTFLETETNVNIGAAENPGAVAVGSSGAIGEYDANQGGGQAEAPNGGFRPALPDDAEFAFADTDGAPDSLFGEDLEADTLFVSGNSADEGGDTFISGNSASEGGDVAISGNTTMETGDGPQVVGGPTEVGETDVLF